MSYDHKVVPTHGVKEGYDRIAPTYHEYHKWLDSFDDAEWRRYLPRSLRGASILDVGAGDGRMYQRFKDSGYGRYVAADISADLIAQHPGDDVETFVMDMEDDRPWSDGEFDLVTSFFVLEHIEDIQHVADEVSRVMTATGVWIFTHFPQRREYVHGQGQDSFKIELHHHRYEEIESAMELAGFEVHSMDLLDDFKVIGKVYAGVRG